MLSSGKAGRGPVKKTGFPEMYFAGLVKDLLSWEFGFVRLRNADKDNSRWRGGKINEVRLCAPGAGDSVGNSALDSRSWGNSKDCELQYGSVLVNPKPYTRRKKRKKEGSMAKREGTKDGKTATNKQTNKQTNRR